MITLVLCDRCKKEFAEEDDVVESTPKGMLICDDCKMDGIE